MSRPRLKEGNESAPSYDLVKSNYLEALEPKTVESPAVLIWPVDVLSRW